MKAAILGLGESLEHFDGEGVTFGVNEICKYVPNIDYLLLMNPPNRHTLEEVQIIRESKPKNVVTYYPHAWLKYWMEPHALNSLKGSLKYKEVFFQNGRKIRLSPWRGAGNFEKDRIYHSITSPFVGISLAAFLGFKEIVLWGVDFRTHGSYPVGSDGHEMEVKRYKELSEALAARGVTVSHGVKNFSFLEI